jgi:putative DNA-invertase from lambdoid prophage Rac
MGGLIFNIMGAFAQFERDLTSDRTKQALAAKKANGQKLGAPQKLTDEQRAEIKSLRGIKSCKELAEMYGVDVSTISRIK